MDKSVKDEIKGKAYRIVHCLGALESFQEALGHVDARKHSTSRRGERLGKNWTRIEVNGDER